MPKTFNFIIEVMHEIENCIKEKKLSQVSELLDIALTMVKEDKDYLSTDEENNSITHYAAWFGHVELIRELAKKKEVTWGVTLGFIAPGWTTKANCWGFTPFALALRAGKAEILGMFIDSLGINLNNELDFINYVREIYTGQKDDKGAECFTALANGIHNLLSVANAKEEISKIAGTAMASDKPAEQDR
jgi:ankyrin repeat protein